MSPLFIVLPFCCSFWCCCLQGRSLTFIEDYLRHEVLPLYANTHTVANDTGSQTSMFRHEARDIVLRSVHASKDDVAFFVGSGSTAAINLLVHVLGCERLIKEEHHHVVVLVGPYEHHANILPWREAGCTVVTIPEATLSGTVSARNINTLYIVLHS